MKSERKRRRNSIESELDFRIHTLPGLEMENLVALGAGRVLVSPQGKRSFPPLAETPRLLIDKSLRRPQVGSSGRSMMRSWVTNIGSRPKARKRRHHASRSICGGRVSRIAIWKTKELKFHFRRAVLMADADMSIEQSKPDKRSRSRKRKFYELDFYRTGNPSGFYLDDSSPFNLWPGKLSNFAGPPCVTFNTRGRRPRDVERWFAFWLISDRAKAVFETTDPEAFTFVACDVQVPGGVWDGPRYWFCDVKRILDALDEERSRLAIEICDDPTRRDFGQKCYGLYEAKLTFKDKLVGNARVFRMAYADHAVICDEDFKRAWKAAGLRGLLFTDASDLSYWPVRIPPAD